MTDIQTNSAEKVKADSNEAPLKTFRIGSVKAAIWKNEAEGRSFYSTKIIRTYRDGEEWKETNIYSHDDLMNVAKLAERAEAYIDRLQS